jgi:hypothetical protein
MLFLSNLDCVKETWLRIPTVSPGYKLDQHGGIFYTTDAKEQYPLDKIGLPFGSVVNSSCGELWCRGNGATMRFMEHPRAYVVSCSLSGMN